MEEPIPIYINGEMHNVKNGTDFIFISVPLKIFKYHINFSSVLYLPL